MYRNFSELIHKVQTRQIKKRVAVAAAEDEHTLEAVFSASAVITPLLVGDEGRIRAVIAALGQTGAEYKIVGTDERRNPARLAVELIKNGEADFIMKGKMETAHLLKEVVDKDSGLHTGRLMSHVAFFEIPSYHKLLVHTDTGMVTNPDLDQKVEIVRNVVEMMNRLGYQRPNVAVLAAVEQVNPKMPETVAAAALKRLNALGELKHCLIEGPLSYALAMSKEAARIKGFSCPQCGDFDVMVVPNLVTGNILGKSLVYSAGAKMAGMIVGAKVPIVLTSRGATAEEKYLSLVISAGAA